MRRSAPDRAVTMLESSPPLAQCHDLALVDLDGVVYIGEQAVPFAVDSLQRAHADGMDALYVTNNASRPPEVVARHLVSLGLTVGVDDVFTSSQAAARLLHAEIPAGSRVLAVGGEGVSLALREVGLTPVTTLEESPVAVVMGFGREVSWADLETATRAVRAGARFVATNLDRTFPTPQGPAPGNGALVQAVADAAEVVPLAMGKPEPGMFREAVALRQARRPLVVGDRLDTDIEGGVRAGYPTLLVLTGVTDELTLLRAPQHQRPTFIAADLRGLLAPHRAASPTAAGWRCGRFVARREDRQVVVRADADSATSADADFEPLDAVRAACAAAWEPSADDTVDPTQEPSREEGRGRWHPIDGVVGLDEAATG